ncbi:hypothetical protein HELRODRAFT_176905 [Helobdella robusta]|uniref:Uncharacterized protein n=1 Tax=Helobdella robusta TaxID=6412 RepID=T1FB14_HELRO|nr:hypothetical protein HELRODRAFT_176905 [Helobdella robusta]ESN98435.1 hypothetical protein HELRODRAFT_176905 [Helobdella robusta]
MSESYLHLMRVNIRPYAYIKDVISGCWRNIQDGIRDKGTIVYGFKVIGENCLVFNGGIEEALESMNSAYGEQIEVSCQPLRSYETFAEHVLGVEKTIALPSTSKLSANGGQLFWLEFNIDYQNVELSSFLSTWKAEALTEFNLRNNGKMELEVYKTVGKRQIHLFVKLSSCDLLDDIVFTLPLIKELGNQIEIRSKSITKL